MHGIDMGRKFWGDMLVNGSWKKTFVLGAALFGMYAKCGVLQKAQKVPDELCVQDVHLEFINCGICPTRHKNEAVGCFQQMQSESITLDAISLATVS